MVADRDAVSATCARFRLDQPFALIGGHLNPERAACRRRRRPPISHGCGSRLRWLADRSICVRHGGLKLQHGTCRAASDAYARAGRSAAAPLQPGCRRARTARRTACPGSKAANRVRGGSPVANQPRPALLRFASGPDASGGSGAPTTRTRLSAFGRSLRIIGRRPTRAGPALVCAPHRALLYAVPGAGNRSCRRTAGLVLRTRWARSPRRIRPAHGGTRM